METISEKKVSHTPGPWEIRYGSGIDMKIIAEDFGKVCEIEGPNTIEAMDEYEAEFVANAKLIAAAPDMLEALIRALTAGKDRQLFYQKELIPNPYFKK